MTFYYIVLLKIISGTFIKSDGKLKWQTFMLVLCFNRPFQTNGVGGKC
jgi:hypothetical protein